MELSEVLPDGDPFSQQLLHCPSSSSPPIAPLNTLASSLASLQSIETCSTDHNLSLHLSSSSFLDTLASTFSSSLGTASPFSDSLSQWQEIGSSEALSWECSEQCGCATCDSTEGSECPLHRTIPDVSCFHERNEDLSPLTLQDAVHCESSCRRDAFSNREPRYGTVPNPVEALVPLTRIGYLPDSETSDLSNSASAETIDLESGDCSLCLHNRVHDNRNLVSQKSITFKNLPLPEDTPSASTTFSQQKTAAMLTESGKIFLLETGSPLRSQQKNATIVSKFRVANSMPYQQKCIAVTEMRVVSGKENAVKMEDNADSREGLRQYKQTTLSRLQNIQQSPENREQSYARLGATIPNPTGWLCPRAAKKNFKVKPRQILLDDWLAKLR